MDLIRYNSKQIVEMLMNPDLRHEVRVIHSCDDWEIYRHPEWMLEQFFISGRVERFRKEHPELF